MSTQPSLRLRPATFGTSCRLLRYIFAPRAAEPGEAMFRFACFTIALHHPVTAALAFEKKFPAAGSLHARYAIAANPEKVPRCARPKIATAEQRVLGEAPARAALGLASKAAVDFVRRHEIALLEPQPAASIHDFFSAPPARHAP